VDTLVDIASLPLEKLTDFVTQTLGEKPFRAKQIYKWLHQRGVTDFAQMTDLSKGLRDRLLGIAELRHVEKDLEQRSIDGTIKYRFKTRDGKLIESVHMPSLTTPYFPPRRFSSRSTVPTIRAPETPSG
jgi:23S rRNA (adenine2503-C2)-methyltransferase